MSKEVVIWLTIAVYIVFIAAVGLISRRSSKSMTDFTVGGRNAGAWVTALSYGTAYFSAVMFIGYAGTTDGNTGYGRCCQVWAMRYSALFWPGWCWLSGRARSPGG